MEIKRAEDRHFFSHDLPQAAQGVTFQIFVKLTASRSVEGKIDAVELPQPLAHLVADMIHGHLGTFAVHQWAGSEIAVIGQQVDGHGDFSGFPDRPQRAAQIGIGITVFCFHPFRLCPAFGRKHGKV